MRAQLTKQNCSRQPALIYIENLCKNGSNYSKGYPICFPLFFYTYYNSYLSLFLRYGHLAWNIPLKIAAEPLKMETDSL